MNEDTLVSVHCYAGDKHQVEGSLPVYTHHQCPVIIMSPTDSPVVIDHPGVESVQAGLVGYVGQVSLDRQLAQMKALLAYPHKFFLMNDSDSGVLDAELPRYLFEQDVVWSNQVDDGIPNREPFPDGWPEVAFQPPYFVSRAALEKMVAAGESGSPAVVATASRPFIDFYMVQLTMVAGLPWRRIKDAVSFPITINSVAHPNPNSGQRAAYDHGFKMASHAVRSSGASVLHSVKDGPSFLHFLELRKQYVEANPGWQPKDVPPPWVGPSPRGAQRSRAQTSVTNDGAAQHQRAQLLVQQRRVFLDRLRHTGLKA